MTETLVPAVRTLHSARDLYDAFRLAAPNLPRASLLVLLSQWSLETGGGAWMWCNNVGNIKHVHGDGHDFCAFRHNEIVGGKEIWLDDPPKDPPQDPFRAYSNLTDGAYDYLAVLHREFRTAWPAVLAGDAVAFVKALKAANYFTADEGMYQRAVVALDAQLSREIPDDPPLADEIRTALLGSALAFDPGQPTPPEDIDPPPGAA
jgi:hypothetical protein